MGLGQGWKVNPFIKPKAGGTVTIMDVDGPGVIQHIFIATETNWAGNGRACVLRFYWDGEPSPSVEVPLTDFFAVGHDRFAPVSSLAVVVNPTSALNCYWPMPFHKHVKITFSNESDKELTLLAYQITYAKTDIPENAGYLHAQWRRGAVYERSCVYDPGRSTRPGSLRRDVPGMDSDVRWLVRGGRSEVFHRWGY